MIAFAGHPAPFLNGSELSRPGALPLGIRPNASYKELAISLQAGDHLSLYTDGLFEARSASGEIYGFDRLKNLFSTQPDAAQATEAAVAFGQGDEITVLTPTRLKVGEESSTLFTPPVFEPASS